MIESPDNAVETLQSVEFWRKRPNSGFDGREFGRDADSCPLLSVVFISYNRSELLVRSVTSTVRAIEKLGVTYEIIIADDCSSAVHAEAIDAMGADKVVKPAQNSGLGANVNSGLRACNGKYILQIQDDWEFVGSKAALFQAIEVLRVNRSVGIVQLTPVHSDLRPKSYATDSGKLLVFKNDGLPWNRSCGVRPYSDCPHLKRSEFVADMGEYLEGVPMGVCENDFKRRVAVQRKWRVALLAELEMFVHLGAEVSLNPGGKRNPLVIRIRSIPLLGNGLEQIARKAFHQLDHLCAVIYSLLTRR